MMLLKTPLVAIILVLCVAVGSAGAEVPALPSTTAAKPVSVAIFTRNNTKDANNDKYVDMFHSGLNTELSGKFTIIDKNDVLSTFKREAKKEEKSGFQITDLFPFINVLTQMKEQVAKQGNSQGEDGKLVEQKASSLRIAQSIGASYFLVADVEEIVSNNIKDTVYGNQINDVSITADVALKILDGVKGGTIVAENVRVEKRLHGDEKSSYTSDDVAQALPVLMKQAATDVSKKFLDNIDKIRGFKVDAVQVKFKVKSNVSGVTVELDGAAIGTAPGPFVAMTGPHRMRVTKQGYRTFERDVNVFDNAEFSVSLEQTEEQAAKQKQGKADNSW